MNKKNKPRKKLLNTRSHNPYRGKTELSELGNAHGDYINGPDSKMGYTDYEKAHTQTTLINPNQVKVRQYKNVDELNKQEKNLFN